MIQIQPSHVAVLVPSVSKAAAHLAKFDFQIGKEEVWDGEGTKEIYVEGSKANSLLLMEPIKAGAYQRALEKRGPGLHHLAIDVINLESFLDSLAGSGWLLHPLSVKTMQQSQTAYLARPGFPSLIEVQSRKEISERPMFVKKVSLPFDPTLVRLTKSIGLQEIIELSDGQTKLTMDSHVISLEELL